jgi:RNA 2',3'-cyclic 3'-phosphodiesterase
MPRLFIAIDMPDHVKQVLTELPRNIAGARWVGPEELHLTLRFIGEVDQLTFTAIRKALSNVRFSSFPLTLCRVGHFPPRRDPRVLWVGMENSEALDRLQQNVELALVDAAIAPDERPFSPHITLARFKETPASAVLRFETAHADLVCPSFEVTEFILYSSVLTPKGAIHTKEAVYGCS